MTIRELMQNLGRVAAVHVLDMEVMVELQGEDGAHTAISLESAAIWTVNMGDYNNKDLVKMMVLPSLQD